MKSFFDLFIKQFELQNGMVDFFGILIDIIAILIVLIIVVFLLLWLVSFVKKDNRIAFYSFTAFLLHLILFGYLNVFIPKRPTVIYPNFTHHTDRSARSTKKSQINTYNAKNLTWHYDTKEEGIYLINYMPQIDLPETKIVTKQNKTKLPIPKRTRSVTKPILQPKPSKKQTIVQKKKESKKVNSIIDKKSDATIKNEKQKIVKIIPPSITKKSDNLIISKKNVPKIIPKKKVAKQKNPVIHKEKRKLAMLSPSLSDIKKASNKNPWTEPEYEYPTKKETRKLAKVLEKKQKTNTLKSLKKLVKKSDTEKNETDNDPEWIKKNKQGIVENWDPGTHSKLLEEGSTVHLTPKKYKAPFTYPSANNDPNLSFNFDIKGFDDVKGYTKFDRIYLREVVAKIGKKWFFKNSPLFPIAIGTQKAGGSIIVRFDLNSKGKVTHFRFIKKNGKTQQDGAVKRTFKYFKKAKKLRKPPPEVRNKNYKMTFRIHPPIRDKMNKRVIILGEVLLQPGKNK